MLLQRKCTSRPLDLSERLCRPRSVPLSPGPLIPPLTNHLGIHILPALHPSITHHLTPTYTLAPALATSLVALSTLVKPEWLVTVLAAGRSGPGELSTLEETFALPPTSKFRPTFAPALPPRLKKFDIWQPNEERVGLFRGHRFVFAGEKGAEAPGVLKELVRSAEGEYECFAVENGPGRFRQVLAKGKARGSTLVLIADQYAVVAAVGEDGWGALKEEARRRVCCSRLRMSRLMVNIASSSSFSHRRRFLKRWSILTSRT